MILDDVRFPAPRYLMRLAALQDLFHGMRSVPRTFLEIGAGSGDVSGFIIRRYPGVSGLLLDFSEEAFLLLSQRFSANGRVRVSNEDFSRLDDGISFDLVMAFEVLEHIDDDVGALRRIGAVTAAGGTLLLSVPAFRRKWQAADEYAGHYRRYERDELRQKLEAAGFDVEAIHCYGFPITELTYPFRQLHYRRALRRSASGVSAEALTKASGVERPYSRVLKQLRLGILLQPFFMLQRCFYGSSMGDGFVVLARRRSEF